MKLIVGLGNPGRDYEKTRHNTGFMALDLIAKELNISVTSEKFKGLYGKGNVKGESVILLKPQTYMNLSGESIKECVDFYKIDLENLIVIYDDIDIEKGVVKIRKQGGAGSHNGMKSVIECLESQQFARVRVGIGMPEYKDDLINYVIGYVPKDEKEILDKSCEKAKEAVIEIVKSGIDMAMNKLN